MRESHGLTFENIWIEFDLIKFAVPLLQTFDFHQISKDMLDRSFERKQISRENPLANLDHYLPNTTINSLDFILVSSKAVTSFLA